jgi:hypothetical protein
MKTIEIIREEDMRDRYRTEAVTDITTEIKRTGTEDKTTKTGEMKIGVAESIATWQCLQRTRRKINQEDDIRFWCNAAYEIQSRTTHKLCVS